MAERIRKTAFGPVNAAAVERLLESFKTQSLLDAVDQVDRLAEWIGDSFRKDLLRLHGMAVWSRYSNSLTQRVLAPSARQEVDPRVTWGCNVAKIPLTGEKDEDVVHAGIVSESQKLPAFSADFVIRHRQS